MNRHWALLIGILLTIVVFSPVSAAKYQEITAGGLCDHEIDGTEWHFIINQIDEVGNAPLLIPVTWGNGAFTEDVPLASFSEGGVAHYVTTSHLDMDVTEATAEIYADWGGQFNLSHGPACHPTAVEIVSFDARDEAENNTFPAIGIGLVILLGVIFLAMGYLNRGKK